MAKVDREKLRAQVDASGKSARAVSLAAGLGESAVRDILSGKSLEPAATTLHSIAGQLGVGVESFMGSDEGGGGGVSETPARFDRRTVQIVPQFLPVRYKVQAGHWVEVEYAEPPREADFAVAPSPRYGAWPQWLEQVVGDSANLKVEEGQFVHVVDAIEMGYAPRRDDWVVVERRRYQGAERERTIKQIAIRPDGAVELWPRSKNPKWNKPLMLIERNGREIRRAAPHPAQGDAIEVEIVGLVIGAYDADF